MYSSFTIIVKSSTGEMVETIPANQTLVCPLFVEEKNTGEPEAPWAYFGVATKFKESTLYQECMFGGCGSSQLAFIFISDTSIFNLPAYGITYDGLSGFVFVKFTILFKRLLLGNP